MIIVLKQLGTCVNYLNIHPPPKKQNTQKCGTNLCCLNCKSQNYYDIAPEQNFYKVVIIYWGHRGIPSPIQHYGTQM